MDGGRAHTAKRRPAPRCFGRLRRAGRDQYRSVAMGESTSGLGRQGLHPGSAGSKPVSPTAISLGPAAAATATEP